MSPFVLRPINLDNTDPAALAAIYEPYVLSAWVSFEVEPPSAQEMARRAQSILDLGLPYVVAQDQTGDVVGYAYASQYRPRPAYRNSVESSIYLSERAQGQGLARALMDALIADCTAKNYKTMVAVVGLNPDLDLDDNQSVRFHQKYGFQPVGVLKNIGHKFGRWTDTALFQLPLTD